MRMLPCRMLLGSLVVVLLSSCAPIDYQNPINASSAPNTSTATLYGQFMLQRDFMNFMRLAIQLKDVGTGKMRSIRFRDDEPIYAFEVPPGTYQLVEIVYAPIGAASFEVTHLSFPAEAQYLTTPFTVEAGKAYYLGDFVGTSQRTGFGMTDRVVWTSFAGNMMGAAQKFAETTDKLKRVRPKLATVQTIAVFEQ